MYFPVYMILVGGQFVVLLGLLHAALPSGTASFIVGALSTVLNIIYFVSVGYLINLSCLMILGIKWSKYYENDPDDQLQLAIGPDVEQQLVRAASLMLAGSIILVVSWSLVQFVSFFYERHPQPSVPARNLWYVIVECWKNRTMLISDVSESVRLASYLAILPSAIGWGTFMGGLFNMNMALKMAYLLLGGWSAVIVTPLMYLASLFHAGCTGKASTVLGIVTSILNTFYIVGMGFSVTFTGQFLYILMTPELAAVLDAAANPGGTATMSIDVQEVKKNGYLMLVGGVVCLIFWTIVLVLWPFYRPIKETNSVDCSMKNRMNGINYDYHPLLPESSLATECTESHESMDQCNHSEVEATSV